MNLNDTILLLVASSAVMLIFGHAGWEYPGLPEILIYPGPFDDNYNLHTSRKKRTLSGIVVPGNAIVISSGDLIKSFRNAEDGYHVGLHEFAHALDMVEGHAEGIPAYLQGNSIRKWNDLMNQEMRLVEEGVSVLDPYAAKNQGELFAVAIEYFFQRPVLLKERHPELYGALSAFLNQDPAESEIS